MSTYLQRVLYGLLLTLDPGGEGMLEPEIPAEIPASGMMGGPGSYLRIILYLLCFVAVLVLAAKATRWLGGRVGRRQGRYIQVVDTLYLGPNCFLSLILVCRRLYLIGTAERKINLLKEIDDPEVVALILKENAPAEDGAERIFKGKSFADYLQRLLGGFSDGEGNSLRQPGAESPAERIEERLMKLRTHRGPSEDE